MTIIKLPLLVLGFMGFQLLSYIVVSDFVLQSYVRKHDDLLASRTQQGVFAEHVEKKTQHQVR